MTLGETFISLGLSSTGWLVLNYSATPLFPPSSGPCIRKVSPPRPFLEQYRMCLPFCSFQRHTPELLGDYFPVVEGWSWETRLLDGSPGWLRGLKQLT